MKEKYSKRGAAIEQLPIVLIAVFILLVVGYFAVSFYTGNAIPFAKYLPDFGLNKDKVKGIEILRYSIVDDNVQYYDGVRWIDFQGNAELEDKTVNYDQIKLSFIRIFDYSSFDNKKTDMDSKGSYVLYGSLYGRYYELKNSDVVMRLFVKVPGENPYVGLYALGMKNDWRFYSQVQGKILWIFYYDKKIRTSEIINKENELKSEAISLRDIAINNAMKKPIEITYYINENGKLSEGKKINVCVEKNGVDLVIDLSKPRENCGG